MYLMRKLALIFVVGLVALGAFALQPWKWLAPRPGEGPGAVRASEPSDTRPAQAPVAPPSTGDATPVAASPTPADVAANATPRAQPTTVPNPTVPPPTKPGVPQLDTFDIIPSERTVDVAGNTVYDGTFTLKGAGTADQPYEITWEYLTSIERTYDPTLGRRQVPERIAMLHGKYVRISGYIAFPILDNRSDELLAMLNQWDGCCIGVPPTPYDAIEVRLNTPVTGEERYTTYGTVTGKLGVEPYVVTSMDERAKFLLGVYVLNGAKLTGAEAGGVGF